MDVRQYWFRRAMQRTFAIVRPNTERIYTACPQHEKNCEKEVAKRYKRVIATNGEEV